MFSKILILLFIFSCAGGDTYQGSSDKVYVPTTSDKTELSKEDEYDSRYSEVFIGQVKKSKKFLRKKDYANARKTLNTLKDEEISVFEQAEKYNVLGLVYFNEGKISKAQILFEKAYAKVAGENSKLKNQLLLNLSAAAYKKSDIKKSVNYLQQIDTSKVTYKDAKKKHLLSYFIATKLKRENEQIHALINYFDNDENRGNVLQSKFYTVLKEKFFKQDELVQKSFIEQYKNQKNNFAMREMVVTYRNALKQKGDRSSVDELQSIIGTDYLQYESQINFFSAIDRSKVGIVLPLTGEKANFATKILSGVSLALKNIGEPFELVVRDSQNIPALAVAKVSELIEQENVSLIIGGLFSNTSEREYEAARKRGVIFLSLSQVNTNRFNKNKLLVELQGSIESQVSAALNNEVASRIGNKVTLLYPNNELGHSYLDEFWNQAKVNGFELIETSGFEKGINDFREAIGKLSGIEYTRAKEKEYRELVKQYKKDGEEEKIEEIELLKPTLEYDWVFIPSFPKEALQIIPSFKYLGVKDINFVGGPSWKSRSLFSQKKYLGNVNFVTDIEGMRKNEFVNIYKSSMGMMPKLLETLGYESVYLANQILSNNFSTRKELGESLMSKSSLNSYLGQWNSENNLWLKKMRVEKL